MDREFLEKFISTQQEIITKLSVIETKIDDYKEVKDKCDSAYTKSNQNEKDIEELNNKITWISRCIVGAIISCVVALFFTLVK